MSKREVPAIVALTVALVAGFLALVQLHAAVPGSPKPAEKETNRVFIRWNPVAGTRNQVVVDVNGLSASALRQLNLADWTIAQWSQLFSVYASQGDLMSDLRIPHMTGRYVVESN